MQSRGSLEKRALATAATAAAAAAPVKVGMSSS